MSDGALSLAGSRHSTEDSVPFFDLRAQHATTAAEMREAVEAVFASGQFILGDEVAELECRVAEYCDALHAVGCGSGSDALLLSLLALDIGRGHEVITSPFTFFATAAAIARCGAKPVFVDVDPASFTLEPERVEAAVTPRTRAIVPVHLFGQCGDMESLFRIAARHRLAIIEDACQAIGAEYFGRRAGVLGTLACFSFFPTKNLGGAGDGGLITTDDAELAARLRRLRGHGDSGGGEHVELGMNSRLDALQAAVLRVKLQHLPEWTADREANARRYGDLFAREGLLGAVDLPKVPPGRRHVFNQYTVRIRGNARDAVWSHLRIHGVGAAVYYPKPLHLQPAFRGLRHSVGDFPEAESAAGEVLSLPIFPELQPSQQETVVRRIAEGIQQAARNERPGSAFGRAA